MKARAALGQKRYGQPLLPFCGKGGFQQAYEKAIDLVVYRVMTRTEWMLVLIGELI
jgi:hypothetical protein